MSSRVRLLACLALLSASFVPALAAPAPAPFDEGMWTFDNPPLAQLKQRYGFEPDAKWLEHVRLSSVRFNSGGSGSFVSKDGLVMTNHHVGLESIQKLSTPEHDMVKEGFCAASREQELACPDLELNVLVSMDDVTVKVNASTKPETSSADANAARKAAIAAIEKDESDRTKLRCDVVKLYDGGEYWVYRYQKFTDIRFVFAPEQQTAYFGGDDDNFVYPRYDLDVSFFRVYVDGKPYQPKHWFSWNPEGCKEGDLVFMSGNPGNSGRLKTFAQLEFQRTTGLPRALELLTTLMNALDDYSKQGAEQERRAKDLRFGISNNVKSNTGYLGGLASPQVMARKSGEEKSLRAKLQDNAAALAEYDAASNAIADAYRKYASYQARHYWSRLQGDAVGRAVQLVRAAVELQKPNAQRLPEFQESRLPTLQRSLLSPAPIHLDMDEVLLRTALELAKKKLGDDDPFVKAALNGKSPAEAAKAALAHTKLDDPALRKAIYDGGAKAIDASGDSLLAFVKPLDPILRELRKRFEDDVDSVESANAEKISKARFLAFGRAIPPDATFTPRLSYGVVKGYDEDGHKVAWDTTIGGTFDHSAQHGAKPPFDLVPRWTERKAKLDAATLATPFDFVTTCDIMQGNSGSPVVGRDGRLVGIVFDGNIQSLATKYVYDDLQSRSVAVHATGILTALRKLYDANALVDEILASSKGAAQ